MSSLAGGVAEVCEHHGCENELHACCPLCLGRLCIAHLCVSRCHEHGNNATPCPCVECSAKQSSPRALEIEAVPMQCETQEECGEDEDGETVTFPTNSSTTGETPVVPEQVEPDAKQGVNVKCKTRVRHHTLRLGLTAACYAKLGRLQAPFLLTCLLYTSPSPRDA